jgi:hypothetical protein
MKAIHKLSLNKMDSIIQDYVAGMSIERKKPGLVRKKTHRLRDNSKGYGGKGNELNFTRETTLKESSFCPDGH